MTRSVTMTAAVLAMTFAATTISAQVLPVRLYGGAQSERATALVQAADMGFCLAGWTRSFGPGTPNTSNVLVVKTDPAGIPIWSRMSIGALDDEAHSMVRTQDGGCVVAGWTRSYGPGIPNKNIFCIKLDPAGNQVWGWVYGGMQDDEAYSVIETGDGGFALTGATWSFGPQPTPNIFVLRLNPQGWPVWFQTYWASPMHVEDEGRSIIQTPDSGFAVCGRMKASTPNNFDPFLMKLSPAGNVQWARVSPGVYDEDEAWSVALDHSAGILVAGWTRSFGSHPQTFADAFVARFTLSGALAWSNTYGWPTGNEQVLDDRALVATFDGGSAFSGLTTSKGPGIPSPNMLVTKLNPNGAPVWTRSHPSPYWPGLGSDVALPMVEQAMGGYAVAGWTSSYTLLGMEDFMLSTFDAMGNRPVCAEPQEPELDSLPWQEWSITARPYYVSEDTMHVVPVAVQHDSVCYDTVQMGAWEMTNGQVSMTNTVGLTVRLDRGTVKLSMAQAGHALVQVFSADGRLVSTLADAKCGAGVHELALPVDGASGTFIVRALIDGAAVAAKSVRY